MHNQISIFEFNGNGEAYLQVRRKVYQSRNADKVQFTHKNVHHRHLDALEFFGVASWRSPD